MTVVFLLPLVLSFLALAYFISSDSGPVTKGVVGVLVVAAACLQFIPTLQESVHFLVPLFMQLIVGGWYYFAMHLD